VFRLAVINDEVSQDLERVCAVAREYRLQAVELRTVWEKNVHELTDAEVAEARRLTEAHGLSICAIASPFYKCRLTGGEPQQHLEILRRCLEIAHAWGVKIVRGFGFWETGHTDRIWPEMVGHYFEPARLAADAGITLAVENEAATSLRTARLLAQFLAEVRAPSVRALWDPANEVYAVGDGETPYPDAFRRVEPWMVHVHIKDARLDDAGKPICVRIGDGSIDWTGQLRALIESGYEGYVSLETHWRPTAELDDDLLNRPGGSAFSEQGEVASRICLERWAALLREVGWQPPGD
jgi:L-ribulose-5-phosphate 3-epimerase